MARAVFLDRDGTVSEEVGYLQNPGTFQIYPYAPLAIRKLNETGLRTFLVTNQSGVARGFFNEDLLHEIHRKLQAQLREERAHLDAIYYCPHHPEGSVAFYRQDAIAANPDPA
jgi:D-glycero-D-manno-heptose 1,7-bisphosphate phosphatase